MTVWYKNLGDLYCWFFQLHILRTHKHSTMVGAAKILSSVMLASPTRCTEDRYRYNGKIVYRRYPLPESGRCNKTITILKILTWWDLLRNWRIRSRRCSSLRSVSSGLPDRAPLHNNYTISVEDFILAFLFLLPLQMLKLSAAEGLKWRVILHEIRSLLAHVIDYRETIVG